MADWKGEERREGVQDLKDFFVKQIADLKEHMAFQVRSMHTEVKKDVELTESRLRNSLQEVDHKIEDLKIRGENALEKHGDSLQAHVRDNEEHLGRLQKEHQSMENRIQVMDQRLENTEELLERYPIGDLSRRVKKLEIAPEKAKAGLVDSFGKRVVDSTIGALALGLSGGLVWFLVEIVKNGFGEGGR